MSDTFETIRDTPLKKLIGAKLLDITTLDKEELLAGEENCVYFHFDNGMTLLARMNIEGEEATIGIDDGMDDDEVEAS